MLFVMSNGLLPIFKNMNLNEELVKLAKETVFSFDEISRVADTFKNQDLGVCEVLKKTRCVLLIASFCKSSTEKVLEDIKKIQ